MVLLKSKFTHDQISLVVVSRLFGFSAPIELAACWRLVRADPETAVHARAVEARIQHLAEHAEDHGAHFKR